MNVCKNNLQQLAKLLQTCSVISVMFRVAVSHIAHCGTGMIVMSRITSKVFATFYVCRPL